MKKNLYGIYPGKLKYDATYIKNCSEMELFIQVDNYLKKEQLLKYLEYCNQMKEFYERCEDYNTANYFKELLKQYSSLKNYIIENLDEINYALDFCILQTNRFNTKVEYNPNGRVIRTKEFNDWYKNFNLYISTLNKDSVEIYRKCRYESKGLQYFSPDKILNKETVENNVIEINTTQPYAYKKEKSIRQIFA